MRRILFVDDEQHVLDGLRDLLRRHRTRWEMRFANDARVAMEWMDQAPFDVVVSDMRMPGVDGAALLAHVKLHHAATARIILSGQADRESVLRALPAAHQFLSKPCDPESLVVVIERACQLQSLMSDTSVRDVVGRLDRLPSAPQIYWDLTVAAARPETGLDEITAIIERDPAMALKVLQLVNSAYFATSQRVSSVQQAVSRLGIDLLKALALSIYAFDSLAVPPVRGFSIELLQQHSFMAARLTKELVPNPAVATEAFAAALLHDIGKLVLAIGFPEQFAQIMAEHERTRRPFFEIEQERLGGITHAQVGAYLLGWWGLPLTMVETVANHHIPAAVPDSTAGVLRAVHLADALMDPEKYLTADPTRDGKLDLEFIEQTSLAEKLPEWRALAARLRDELS